MFASAARSSAIRPAAKRHWSATRTRSFGQGPRYVGRSRHAGQVYQRLLSHQACFEHRLVYVGQFSPKPFEVCLSLVQLLTLQRQRLALGGDLGLRFPFAFDQSLPLGARELGQLLALFVQVAANRHQLGFGCQLQSLGGRQLFLARRQTIGQIRACLGHANLFGAGAAGDFNEFGTAALDGRRLLLDGGAPLFQGGQRLPHDVQTGGAILIELLPAAHDAMVFLLAPLGQLAMRRLLHAGLAFQPHPVALQFRTTAIELAFAAPQVVDQLALRRGVIRLGGRETRTRFGHRALA